MKKSEDIPSVNEQGTGQAQHRRRMFLLLHGAILLASFSGVTQKLASGYPLFSLPNLMFYAGTLLLMGLYAVCWQRVLQAFPLSFAYANKGINQIWILLWSWLFFGEAIGIKTILGALMIVSGIVWLGVQGADG